MDDFEKLKIADCKYWSVYLHTNQYYLGRVYVWAKRDDAIDLMEATHEEIKELIEIGNEIKRSLGEMFQPDLMNYSSLGNETNHLHVHIIPRYKSPREFDGIEFIDERWGKNPSPYNRDFRVPESTLVKLIDLFNQKLAQQSNN